MIKDIVLVGIGSGIAAAIILSIMCQTALSSIGAPMISANPSGICWKR